MCRSAKLTNTRHFISQGRESQPVKRKAGLHRAVQTAVGSAKSSERPELSRVSGHYVMR